MNSRAIEVEVRLASPSDAPRIASLVERYWQFERIAGFDQHEVECLLTALIREPALGAVWLAMLEEEPVGYAIVTFMFSLEHRGMMAEIDEFFVVPQARSRGVGASLIAAAEMQLRARECVRLQLQIDRGNHTALAFYKRHGFGDRSAFQLLDKPVARRASEGTAP